MINNKLLVVEDDPGLQSQIRWCFENYEVLLANGVSFLHHAVHGNLHVAAAEI